MGSARSEPTETILEQNANVNFETEKMVLDFYRNLTNSRVLVEILKIIFVPFIN